VAVDVAAVMFRASAISQIPDDALQLNPEHGRFDEQRDAHSIRLDRKTGANVERQNVKKKMV
jgi:hypothetical protein